MKDLERSINKPVLGVLTGTILGLVDGLSAWSYPEARTMMMAIVIGSTIKGALTGLVTGLVARWRQSMLLGIATGIVTGFALSTLAAQGQPGHYWEIVLPGMLVGAIAGFATQRMRPTLAVLLCLLPVVSLTAGQTPPVGPPSLDLLDSILGRWEGTSEGRPGNGKVEREYSRVLSSRFVYARNRSVYPPQERNPKGEQHEDAGYFSFDRARKTIIFRQFHVEGFVSQYVMEPSSADSTLVFVTESIENIPPGWRARETYKLLGPDELEEIFELAEAGKPFDVYSRTRLKRVR